MISFEKEKSSQTLKPEHRQHYEKLLWDKAAELDVLKKEIHAHIEALDTKLSKQDIAHLNLHQLEERRNDEKMYWQLKAELEALQHDEEKLQKHLEDLDAGVIDAEIIDELIKQIQESQDSGHVSRRKQHILEEQQRLEEEPKDMFGVP